MPDGSGAFPCDLELLDLLTGEGDGVVTREGTSESSCVIETHQHYFSSQLLCGDRALAGNDVMELGWSLAVFPLFHTDSQMHRKTFDNRVVILLLCKQ